MFKKILLFVLFIIVIGLVGHNDYTDAVNSSKQDEINKQEVIKDIQLRCFTGELNDEMLCKGLK